MLSQAAHDGHEVLRGRRLRAGDRVQPLRHARRRAGLYRRAAEGVSRSAASGTDDNRGGHAAPPPSRNLRRRRGPGPGHRRGDGRQPRRHPKPDRCRTAQPRRHDPAPGRPTHHRTRPGRPAADPPQARALTRRRTRRRPRPVHRLRRPRRQGMDAGRRAAGPARRTRCPGVSVLGGVPLGDGPHPSTAPVGTTATLDTTAGTLTIAPGVRWGPFSCPAGCPGGTGLGG